MKGTMIEHTSKYDGSSSDQGKGCDSFKPKKYQQKGCDSFKPKKLMGDAQKSYLSQMIKEK
jgi:hypothetical protein